ncbi:hypothetical protein ACFLVF_03690 [Chloroflexota bacterium]
MNGKVLRFTVATILLLSLLLLSFGSVAAAPPPDGPPGLERATEVKERHAEALFGVAGVVGVGVGHNGDSNPTVIIFTETPGVRGLPTFLEGVPVVVRVSGKFFAQPKPDRPPGKPPKDEEPGQTPRDRWDRPVPIGVSTGHPDITAGTIGARVTDGTKVYALSNNHVYANENKAKFEDAVLQPGAVDGGLAGDEIGTLYAFKPIIFSDTANNVIDAAIALSSTDLLGNATPSDGYGAPKSTTADAFVGMKVLKYGRTTGQTKGRVYAVNFTVDVGYDSGVARFENQIVITPGDFSAGGDSGSLIVVNAKRSSDHLNPVGLLFAGSSLYTIANPIGSVLDAFGVTIDGVE